MILLKILITGSIVTFLPKVFELYGPRWGAILVLAPIVTTVSYLNLAVGGINQNDFHLLVRDSIIVIPLVAIFLLGVLIGNWFFNPYIGVFIGLSAWFVAALMAT